MALDLDRYRQIKESTQDMNTSNVEENPANQAETEEAQAQVAGSEEEVAAEEGASEEQEEQTDWQDRYLRLYAEFDNFRKRTMRERADLIRNASRDVLESLLPVLDDLDRAQTAAADSEDVAGLKEGQQLIHNKLKQILKAQGVEQLEVKPGDAFDVDMHEAITRIPSPEFSGKVVDVVEAGYKLNDVVIRYTKVVVGE
ncbi:MAG: nucleotide exchange factor GrpE [Crocinitomicaceae bacterium]|nr:nucleotide exchange factor GrpE [Crocinitomicaceae bacterium]